MTDNELITQMLLLQVSINYTVYLTKKCPEQVLTLYKIKCCREANTDNIYCDNVMLPNYSEEFCN